MKGVVSHVTCKKVPKAFPLEPSVQSTQKAVGATRQALRRPVPEMSEITDRRTHTRNTAINIIDVDGRQMIVPLEGECCKRPSCVQKHTDTSRRQRALSRERARKFP